MLRGDREPLLTTSIGMVCRPCPLAEQPAVVVPFGKTFIDFSPVLADPPFCFNRFEAGLRMVSLRFYSGSFCATWARAGLRSGCEAVVELRTACYYNDCWFAIMACPKSSDSILSLASSLLSAWHDLAAKLWCSSAASSSAAQRRGPPG